MSDSDSFIDEVTEEVRRDRFYRNVRRYGWIAVLAVVLLVGGAGWYEWQKAQERQQAQAFGDAILSALNAPERAARAEALDEIDAPTDGGRAVLALLTAAEEGTENPESAAQRLLSMADSQGVPQVYRQLATLKAVTIPDAGLSVEDRRMRLDGLTNAGGLTRLLAEEQLALLDLEEGNRDAALERLQRIVEDAEATAGLRQRVSQVIVALGEEPAA
ncbi:tetratricopeptide repeat protein [Roseovarius indicus]|uniref:tetratricopeptide repeat protein n=1 Tax=Roseovarius indicus TaxID=540747 RepID=UPI0007D97F0C|nr:tetratricopeptide repeat protein [Roseovarius indicus]OAN98867.1 hypothetical protein A8B76_22180 [Roseovarius indicus]